jgi:hypothetical protein
VAKEPQKPRNAPAPRVLPYRLGPERYPTKPPGAEWSPSARTMGPSGLPARARDVRPGGQSYESWLKQMQSMAAEEVAQSFVDVKQAEVIALGMKQALAGALVQTAPSPAWQPPRSAEPIDLCRRLLVNVPSANAEQLATGTAMQQALANPVSLDTGTLPDDWKYLSAGTGEAVGFDCPAGHAAVIDRFGVSVFDELADELLLWVLGAGYSSSQTSLAVAYSVIGQNRGWRQADASNPAPVNGRRLILPSQGTVQRVGALVSHNGANAATYTPTPFYVEVRLTGWHYPADAQGNALGG